MHKKVNQRNKSKAKERKNNATIIFIFGSEAR